VSNKDEVTLIGKIFNRKEVMVEGVSRENVGMWSQDITT
jgi:hypothetical protein